MMIFLKTTKETRKIISILSLIRKKYRLIESSDNIGAIIGEILEVLISESGPLTDQQ